MEKATMDTEPISSDLSGYRYYNCQPSHTQAYLLPTVVRVLQQLDLAQGRRRLMELGCGNGALAAQLQELGFEVIGVEPSVSGVEIARRSFPKVSFHVGSSEDDLPGRFGTFPAVVSLEVVEHVFLPRRFAASVYSLLEPGGTAILSTPYHGYWKNLLLALSGKLDGHFTALWDYGHIKFWSIKTMRALLTEAGFTDITFYRVGRVAPLAKSMIAVAHRPPGPVANNTAELRQKG
jgi:SAM-dependent methyltransferase